MRTLSRILASIVVAAMLVWPAEWQMAQAAEIRLEGNNADGVPVVSVKGDFVERDIERFADVTKDLDSAVIVFESDGGEVVAGIEIGTRIRLRGYQTVVDNKTGCHSACAIAWLGGTTRYIGRGAQVGFHAAYLKRDGRFQETGVWNAIVGAYASNLGLKTSAVVFMTSAPPEGLNRLTEDVSKTVGIAAEFGDVDQLLSTMPRREVADPSIAFFKGQEACGSPDFNGFCRDPAEAVKWYRMAAEQGNAEAQNNLGVMYANGEGVPQDYALAVRWFRMAAERGLAEARYNLGFMYARGRGVPLQDRTEAVKWFRMAADQGHALAAGTLGFMYANGEGVPQDRTEAAKWYRLAAERGLAAVRVGLGVMWANGEVFRRTAPKR